MSFVIEKKLQFFGHISRHDGLEHKIMMGSVYGRRRQGKAKSRWVDGVKRAVRLTTVEAYRNTQDRDVWRTIVQNAATAVQDP